MKSAILDLRELPLKTGERLERTFDLDSYPIFLGGQRYEVVPRGDGAAVTVERVSGGFLVTVALDAMVYGACFRCLQEIAQPVSAEEQEFVPSNPEKWGDEDVSPFIEDFEVDIEGLVREAVVLALPDKLLCQAECRGICPSCGADLNAGDCDCEVTAIDPRWEKLRALDLPEEDENRREETG